MERFVDLGVSFFDPRFTLDPFPYLKDLYERKEILGFRADGMNFIFRFDQAQQVIRNRSCRKEPIANAEIEARERIYAERYPNRAKYYQLSYTALEDGRPGFTTKKLMMALLDGIAEETDVSGARPIFEQLASEGRIDDYIESVQSLPLRMMLQSCGLPFTEKQLADLHLAGVQFIKAHDNFVDEAPLVAADGALGCVWGYLDERLPDVDAEAPIRRLIDQGRSLGIDEEKLKVNIGGVLIALSNTLGISSAYLLRNLIRYPEVRRKLAENPDLIRDENVMTELLRRDNHVKALSRQVHEQTAIGDFSLGRGESIHLFFPGVNLDPAQFGPEPLSIDLTRRFTAANSLVFGGSAYVCTGKNLGLAFLPQMTRGFVEHLPDRARVVEDEVEVDGGWVAERIIVKMPIVLEA